LDGKNKELRERLWDIMMHSQFLIECSTATFVQKQRETTETPARTGNALSSTGEGTLPTHSVYRDSESNCADRLLQQCDETHPSDISIVLFLPFVLIAYTFSQARRMIWVGHVARMEGVGRRRIYVG
jgi:hypothetical protein